MDWIEHVFGCALIELAARSRGWYLCPGKRTDAQRKTRVLERTVMYGKANGEPQKADVSFLRTGSYERLVGR
jgi:hypothetical protein